MGEALKLMALPMRQVLSNHVEVMFQKSDTDSIFELIHNVFS